MKSLTSTLHPLEIFPGLGHRLTFEREIVEQVALVKSLVKRFLANMQPKFESELGHGARRGWNRNDLSKLQWYASVSEGVKSPRAQIGDNLRVLKHLVQRMILVGVLCPPLFLLDNHFSPQGTGISHAPCINQLQSLADAMTKFLW